MNQSAGDSLDCRLDAGSGAQFDPGVVQVEIDGPFGQADYDVWNSLAIAIFVIHCCNNMMALKEDLPEYPSDSSSDPDL